MFATLNTHTHEKIEQIQTNVLYYASLYNNKTTKFLFKHVPVGRTPHTDRRMYMWFKKQNLAIDRGSESGCQVRLCLLLLLFVCLSLLGIFMIIISILMVWPRRYMYVVLSCYKDEKEHKHTQIICFCCVCICVFC